MSTQDRAHDDKTPDEIDLLVPWQVIERLTPEEAARVEDALGRDPARARNLAAAREERAETVTLNQDLGLPSRRAREALFTRIAAEGHKARGPGLMQRLRGMLAALSPQALALGSTAAALVIALQAGFLATAYLGHGTGSGAGSGYETASAPQSPVAGGRFALVAFAPTATAAAIEALLRESGASIVDGPRAGGLFRLRLADATADPKAVEALIARLRGQGEVVRLVAPEAAQQGR